MSGISEDLIDFGDPPPAFNALLQQGVSLTRHDLAAGDEKFREALALDPSALAAYLCLTKIHAYGGRLDEALTIAEAGLAEAVRQAGLPDWTRWTAEVLAKAPPGAARFALYTLKAIAFIRLRRGEAAEAARRLDTLKAVGESEGIGGGVVESLLRAVA